MHPQESNLHSDSFLEGIDAAYQDPSYAHFAHADEFQTEHIDADIASLDIHEPEDHPAHVATVDVHEPAAILPEPLPPPRRFCRTVWRSLALRLVNLRAANSSPAPQ